jgi:hypothetical protein
METDFLGCGLDTNCALINAFLPGAGERPLRKVELARRAGVPTVDDPAAAWVSHLERFVAGDPECTLPPGSPGLVEKFEAWEGVRGAYFRLTEAGSRVKAKHAAQHATTS